MLTRAEAAEYVGLSKKEFEEAVAADLLPSAISFGETLLWDRLAIDDAVDLRGGRTPRSTKSAEGVALGLIDGKGRRAVHS